MFEGTSIHVVSNPLAHHFLQQPGSPREEWRENLVILVVARDLLDPLKKVGEIVTAHQKAEKNRSKISLLLVGANGSGWSSAHNVEWLGTLDQIKLKEVYSNCDYLIQPSSGESFGLSVIEAASQGATPIVRGGGALEELQNNLGFGMVFSSLNDLHAVFRNIAAKPRPNSDTRNHLRETSGRLYGPDPVRKHYDRIYSNLGVSQ